jgi:predicted patatin/cPLA2 family phospholipase
MLVTITRKHQHDIYDDTTSIHRFFTMPSPQQLHDTTASSLSGDLSEYEIRHNSLNTIIVKPLQSYQKRYRSLTTRVADLEVELAAMVEMVEKSEKAERVEGYMAKVRDDYEIYLRLMQSK